MLRAGDGFYGNFYLRLKANRKLKRYLYGGAHATMVDATDQSAPGIRACASASNRTPGKASCPRLFSAVFVTTQNWARSTHNARDGCKRSTRSWNSGAGAFIARREGWVAILGSGPLSLVGLGQIEVPGQ